MSILIKGIEIPINCTSCPCSNDETRFCKAANEYIPMLGKPSFCPLEEPRMGKWIPCIEKYPDMDETVLVYTNSHEYHVWDCTSNRGDGYFWEDEEGYYHNKYEVALWMPLPEPWKGKQ